nr:hypothetical protein [Desulfuromonas acetoxidans]
MAQAENAISALLTESSTRKPVFDFGRHRLLCPLAPPANRHFPWRNVSSSSAKTFPALTFLSIGFIYDSLYDQSKFLITQFGGSMKRVEWIYFRKG